MTTESFEDATIGLAEAATLAGVAVSTLRRWADEGRVPSHRTQGGHRRFRLAELRQALAPVTPDGQEIEVFGSFASERIRRQLASPHSRELAWVSGLDEQARDRLRLLGRHLLGTIEDYLARRRPRAAALAEAREFGLLYGRELAAARMTVRQAIEAFTFFRRSLEESSRRHATLQHLGPADLDDLRDHLDVFTDRVLLGIAEAYEPQQGRAADTPAEPEAV